jgi:hypothetical protein
MIGDDLKLEGDAIDLSASGAPRILTLGRTQVEPLLPIAA